MRRFLLFITSLFFLWGLVACTQTSVPPTAVSTQVLPTSSATAVPSHTPIPTPTPVLPTPTPTPIPDVALTANNIFVYPAAAIYAGDRLTIQVMPTIPPSIRPESVTVHLLINGEETAVSTVNNRNIAGQPMALFQWTAIAQPGTHTIQVILDQDNQLLPQLRHSTHNQASRTITVQEATARSRQETDATWVRAESNCCIVYAASGTAAYRDLPQLLPRIETAVQTTIDRLDETPLRKIEVYFVDRIIGQGGYAGSAMVISYSDRPYNGGQLDQMLRHEATHVIDRQFAPRRIPFLAEGVAVWSSDGHYKPENIEERTAALVTLDYYIPLDQLINQFYPVQHEIGYLQAAGFVQYLVNQKGWGRFRTFYSNVTAADAPTLAEAVDLNLQIYYDTTLAALEADWLDHLQSIQPSSHTLADLQTTLHYYDTMRYYQMHYDPTAHFLNAWLPFPNEVREQGNPADLNRRPNSETHLVLETMFLTADEALQVGDFNRAAVLIDSINRAINNDGAFLDPLAINYLNIVRTLQNVGYIPQKITITGNRAAVLATPSGQTTLIQLNLQLRGRNWFLTS